MSARSDVIIIGGGIIGCWTAWHLTNAGCAVTLVERDRIGSGASSGNCGYICPSHVHPLCAPGAVANGIRMMARTGGALSITPRWDPTLWRWLACFAKHCNANDFRHASTARHALLQSSRTQYQTFADRNAADIKWQQRGLLLVYRSERDFEAYEEPAAQLRRDFGLRLDRYDGDDVLQLEPTLRESLAGGWHFPDDAHLSPSELLNQLRHEIEQGGGMIREQTEIESMQFSGAALASVTTTRGETLSADAFVLATGAEASKWGRELGCRIPVIPGKGYSVTYADATGMPETPLIFEDDHVAVTPLGDSFRIGSTMQLTGFDRSVPAARIELLKRSARRHLRVELPDATEQSWAGWRPMMPDGLPCIGPSRRAANAWVAAGNGMIGVATGPATGQLVSELVRGGPPHIDPSPYRVDRFQRSQ
ncbi:D-amino acid dehydrogenase small subunit [Stieleria maiorica]|uniref:D-amino acid dehydrogenase small subunit n=1 Tax=Stieleria maiorica TaxID=2795974 RepID=A0A5B9MPR7_9BACT|nr:FAD-dependent oxidoreductase [Stieleria maiorica]QEG01987.1 D-amino acid dehydrogenase small subunit [Stieleria maiorica]